MEIITVREENGLPCSLCKDVIRKSEEGFRFFSVGRTPQRHYRHLQCQFDCKPRKQPFKKWIEMIKFQLAVEKNKQKLGYHCPHCSVDKPSSKAFVSEYALNQHFKSKHPMEVNLKWVETKKELA